MKGAFSLFTQIQHWFQSRAAPTLRMLRKSVFEEIIKKHVNSAKPFEITEFEACIFENCDFSDTGLSEFDFIDCEFRDCNLSNVKFEKTGLKEVQFTNCKMLGIDFSDCKEFLLAMHFTDCQINFSSFAQLKLPKTRFKNCQMEDVDFGGTDLTAASFDNCYFARATFEYTNLEKADLRTANDFTIDPELNRIKGAKFSPDGLKGLLQKYQIEVD